MSFDPNFDHSGMQEPLCHHKQYVKIKDLNRLVALRRVSPTVIRQLLHHLINASANRSPNCTQRMAITMFV